MYVIGKTGTGKTTMLDNMTIQDIQRGNGVAVLDPHGEYAERMLNFIPKERIDDVVYFNPGDLTQPMGFNMLEKPSMEMRHFVASGLMGVFKKLWPDVWSARMEYFLSNSILAHLEMEDATLLGVNRIFGDATYRKAIVSRIQDPVVRGFWENEFAKLPEQFMREAVAAIQNKVGQFIANPLIRNIIAQPRSTFDLREIMDKKKILIANLSKGRIGEENSSLLGAMLVTRIYLSAMSRVDMPEDEREDFFVYADEFQNFATESFANILSEARKYHLCLTLAHQYMAQLVDDKTKSAVLRDAIIGNVGTIISFRIGAEDAEVLEKEFAPDFVIEDFVNLGFASIYLKLMIDNVASRPFSATTLPPLPAPAVNCKVESIEASRVRYGTPVTEIDSLIREWGGFAPASPKPGIPTSVPVSAAYKVERAAPANIPAAGAALSEPRQGREAPAEAGLAQSGRRPDGRPSAPSLVSSPPPVPPPENALPALGVLDTAEGQAAVKASHSPAPAGIEPVPEVKSNLEIVREMNRAKEAEIEAKRAERRKNQKMYPAICGVCNKAIEVPFQPDSRRPVYCEEHLSMIQRGESKADEAKPAPTKSSESRSLNHEPRRESKREISAPKPMSLNELLPRQSGEPRKEMRSDARPASERNHNLVTKKQEVNLGELRKVLDETINKSPAPSAQNLIPARDQGTSEPPMIPARDEHRPREERKEPPRRESQPTRSPSNGGVIKPGEAIRF